MAGYEVVPSPSYPAPNYQAFGQQIGNLPNDYFQGQQRQQQLAQQQALKNGIPMKDGMPDYSAMAQTFAKLADPNAALQFLQMAQQGGQFQPPLPVAAPDNGAGAPPAINSAPPGQAAVSPAPTPSNASPVFAAIGQQYGVSPSYLAATSQIESSGNPNASNGGAKGLFGFEPATAKQYGLTNPDDPIASTDAAARLAIDNRAYLSKALGRPPTDAELYLAHQQGAKGAAELLASPNAKASDIVGVDAVVGNGGNPKMKAAQFAAMWRGRYSRTVGGTQNFAPSGPQSGGPGVAMPPAPRPFPVGQFSPQMLRGEASLAASQPASCPASCYYGGSGATAAGGHPWPDNRTATAARKRPDASAAANPRTSRAAASSARRRPDHAAGADAARSADRPRLHQSARCRSLSRARCRRPAHDRKGISLSAKLGATDFRHRSPR